MELIPILELIEEESKSWNLENVIPYTLNLGKIVKEQLTKYVDGSYRADRNEIFGFFEAIEKFSLTHLPITLEHFHSLIYNYKKRILPYPHYSGIILSIPENLQGLDNIKNLKTPNN